MLWTNNKQFILLKYDTWNSLDAILLIMLLMVVAKGIAQWHTVPLDDAVMAVLYCGTNRSI